MRTLLRNKQDLWYANPTGVSYKEDTNGYKTGDKVIAYEAAQKVRMSVSPSSGTGSLGSTVFATVEPYGIVTGYTHRAMTDDMDCAMGEESRVWYGILPTRTVKKDGVDVVEAVPHNFKVVRKEKSLNHLTYYLKEVDVQ